MRLCSYRFPRGSGYCCGCLHRWSYLVGCLLHLRLHGLWCLEKVSNRHVVTNMRLLSLLLIATSLRAVTVTDTIALADGSTANGLVVITLASGAHSSSVTYAATRKRVTVTSGAFSVALPANSTLTPAGTLYRVEYFLQGGGSQVEYWNIPTGGPYTIRDVRWRDRAPTGYAASFTGATWTLPASIHGIRTRAMQAACFDGATPAVQIECAVTVHPATFDVVARFASSQTGKLVVSAVAAWSTQNYLKAMTSATLVSVPYTEHKMATNQLTVECWDSATPAAQVSCVPSVHPTTYDVAVTFPVAQSGYVVVSGR